MFGVKRFQFYLYGHHFTLYTDNKPLLTLFSEHQTVSPQASSRIQLWVLTLAMYGYSLAFLTTLDRGNADPLSRLPFPTKHNSTPMPVEVVLLMETFMDSPVTTKQIRCWTRRDPLLGQVLRYIAYGWPHKDDPELKPFWSRRTELSSQDGCILWGSRVVIPPPGQMQLIHKLHEGHPGMSRMKSLASGFLWWPGMDSSIEEKGRRCPECQKKQAAPPVAPLHPWQWPTRPWSRIHIDFAGPFMNRMFLVIIDVYSRNCSK